MSSTGSKRRCRATDYRLYPNVRWISKPDAHSPARDGETDLLIVHPEHGLLVVETKGGRIRRDGSGRWFSGEHELQPPPFQQAEISKHTLKRKLASLPNWPGTGGRASRAGRVRPTTGPADVRRRDSGSAAPAGNRLMTCFMARRRECDLN